MLVEVDGVGADVEVVALVDVGPTEVNVPVEVPVDVGIVVPVDGATDVPLIDVTGI